MNIHSHLTYNGPNLKMTYINTHQNVDKELGLATMQSFQQQKWMS